MRRVALRAIYTLDRIRFGAFRLRWGSALHVGGRVSPNLRLVHLRIERGGRLELEPGVATEREKGNRIWIQVGGRLQLGARTWLRTEGATNQITVGPGAAIRIGPDSLLNGVMLHAKVSIEIGSDARIGFGARILDSDLHDLDRETPERSDPIRIGDRVWIGCDVLVLRGVSVGDDTVVGAGSIVTSDLPARVLALGAPAKPVRNLASRKGCR